MNDQWTVRHNHNLKCTSKTHGLSVNRESHILQNNNNIAHYDDVVMGTVASQITSLTIVYSTVYSGADQRKYQSSASLAFVWGIHRDRWIPRTKGQLRGKCFHLMTSSWDYILDLDSAADGPKWNYWLVLIAHRGCRTPMFLGGNVNTANTNLGSEHIGTRDKLHSISVHKTGFPRIYIDRLKEDILGRLLE